MTTRLLSLLSATLAMTLLLQAPGATDVAAAPAPSPQSDLDAFMASVLASRDENWKKLQQYILDEREVVEVRGPSNIPIFGERREYSWFIREGYFVRSPVKANGVTIAEDDRRKYEEAFLRRAKARDRRGEPDEREGTPPDDPEYTPTEAPRDMGGLLAQTRQPQFIDSAYFLRFKFEQGKYAFVGRETVEGRELLRIEYYPDRLFTRAQDRQQRRQTQGEPRRDDAVDATVEQLMNKVSLVTLWVEPTAHQIVKYTFDNVNLDFLPVSWLVRMDDIKATMTMSQPFKDIWLPRDVEIVFSAMLAIGPFSMRYDVEYVDYREAKTSGRIKGAESLR